MLNAGTLQLNVYPLPYRQAIPEGAYQFNYGFSSWAVEPLLNGSGFLNSNTALQALGLLDYGIMYPPDRTLSLGQIPYNGSEFVTFTVNNGTTPAGSGQNETYSSFDFSFYPFVPEGGLAGTVQDFNPSTITNQQANIDGDDGHLDASLAMGPTSILQVINGQEQASDFCLPYSQYDYFTLYAIGAEQGRSFVGGGDGGGMIQAANQHNTGFENGAGATNALGTFINETNYVPANFIPWDNYRGRTTGQLAPAAQDQAAFPEQPIATCFGIGAYLQNARSFFIFIGGQYFEGQPQTPVIYNPVSGLYQPIQLTAQTPEAVELISAPTGLQIAYSQAQSAFYFINTSLQDYPNYIFASMGYVPDLEGTPVVTRPPVTFRPPSFGSVPKFSMPCYGVRPNKTVLRR